MRSVTASPSTSSMTPWTQSGNALLGLKNQALTPPKFGGDLQLNVRGQPHRWSRRSTPGCCDHYAVDAAPDHGRRASLNGQDSDTHPHILPVLGRWTPSVSGC